MKKKKIGFISDNMPWDKRTWSGTKSKIYEQITKCNVEVIWIPVKFSFTTHIYKICLFLITRLLKKRYSIIHTTFVAKQLSRSIDKSLLESVDLIFAVSGSQYLYQLETTKPIIYLADATFTLLYNYYDKVSNFLPFNVKQGNLIELTALNKASKIIASSDWCKASIENDYGISPNKVHVIEFGANVDEKDIKNNIITPKKESNNMLNILFLAVEWKRKGGEIAIDCVKRLNNEMKIPTKVYIVGTDVPIHHKNESFIESIGFLNKNKENEYYQFIKIIKQCDILLIPTKAECAGIAFCEASAYKLPIFTYDTGGIPNYVENGINGYRLPLSCTGEDFAQKIKTVVEQNKLPSLKDGCNHLYNSKLNWDHWRLIFEETFLNKI